MIPFAYINEWRSRAPWDAQGMIEQDLIISRIVVTLFSDPFLRDALIFRGGTALNKLCFQRPLRYSEDVDLVQRVTGPIGPVFDGVRQALAGWLGASPARKQGQGVVNLVYRAMSEDVPPLPLRIKIEINTREHFQANLAAKLEHPGFIADCAPLLRPGTIFDPQADAKLLDARLLSLLPVPNQIGGGRQRAHPGGHCQG